MAENSTDPQAIEPSLLECDREQIQFLGAVQSFGCLLVMANDWTIRNARQTRTTSSGSTWRS